MIEETKAAVSIGCLMKLKKFLKTFYSLADNKCQAFSPSDSKLGSLNNKIAIETCDVQTSVNLADIIVESWEKDEKAQKTIFERVTTTHFSELFPKLISHCSTRKLSKKTSTITISRLALLRKESERRRRLLKIRMPRLKEKRKSPRQNGEESMQRFKQLLRVNMTISLLNCIVNNNFFCARKKFLREIVSFS